MDDLISRQAAIFEIERCEIHSGIRNQSTWNECVNVISETIKQLQPAQPQQWIPCSERLPEHDFTDVLVCMHDKRKGCEDDYYYMSAYMVRGQWRQTLRIADDLSDLEVIAWQPLPEPYREGNNDQV